MKLTVRWRIGGPTGTIGSVPETIECDSAYVRDGMLTIITRTRGEALERGVPLDLVWEVITHRPAPEPPTLRGSGEIVPWAMNAAAAAKKTVPDPFETMRKVLKGWVEGQRENHGQMGHSSELSGDECWRVWHVEDIERMIDDAAAEFSAF